MALVSGGRSTLNPNAPLFVPAAVRQVEDFSPEWWQLVTTSTWFHEYWLSQQEGDDDFNGNNEDDFEDIVDLLPDTIDLGNEEEFLNMEAQFEQFIQSSEAGIPKTGFEVDHLAVMKSLNLSSSKSTVESAKYWEKPAKNVSPKINSSRIQQPR